MIYFNYKKHWQHQTERHIIYRDIDQQFEEPYWNQPHCVINRKHIQKNAQYIEDMEEKKRYQIPLNESGELDLDLL